jgi:hypothetical protein
MADYNRNLLREIAASNDTGIAEDSLAGVTRVQLVAAEIEKHKELIDTSTGTPASPEDTPMVRRLDALNATLRDLVDAQPGHP